MAGTAVIYHYFEKDPTYRDNLVFFLSRAWRADHDFFVVLAGPHSVTLPERANIHYLATPNFGHDFGGYCTLADTGLLDGHDRLVFVNCTVRGPFLPPYAAALPWTAPFLDLLAGEVHLCGATINILHEDRPAHGRFRASHPEAAAPFSHVQTSAHAMTGECFAFLRDSGHFRGGAGLDKAAVISAYEIGMSQRVRAHGWNIACLLPPYNAIDYRRPHGEINPATTTGHPQARGAYFGLTPHPYELVFVKTGWGLMNARALAFHSLMALRHHPAPSGTGLVWSETEALAARLAETLGPPLATLSAPDARMDAPLTGTARTGTPRP